MAGLQGGIKRGLDLVGASVGLVVLSPLFLLIAAAIRLTNGAPVFYTQTRVGLNHKPFTIIKFRTMRTDAEPDGPVWSPLKDSRATRLGGVLRRSGLDELPQLINVIRGEMSLVGPRPERPTFVESFRRQHREYDLRHAVRPGLTGYSQVHGWRGATDLDGRIEHDLYYLRSYSLPLDLYVLLLTPLRGWVQEPRDGVPR